MICSVEKCFRKALTNHPINEDISNIKYKKIKSGYICGGCAEYINIHHKCSVFCCLNEHENISINDIILVNDRINMNNSGFICNEHSYIHKKYIFPMKKRILYKLKK